jgi:hypothetical protein
MRYARYLADDALTLALSHGERGPSVLRFDGKLLDAWPINPLSQRERVRVRVFLVPSHCPTT